MKTKILITIFSMLFIGASTVVTKAVKEAKLCDAIWTVTYSGSIGTSTGITVSCTTGGLYKCPLCIQL